MQGVEVGLVAKLAGAFQSERYVGPLYSGCAGWCGCRCRVGTSVFRQDPRPVMSGKNVGVLLLNVFIQDIGRADWPSLSVARFRRFVCVEELPRLLRLFHGWWRYRNPKRHRVDAHTDLRSLTHQGSPYPFRVNPVLGCPWADSVHKHLRSRRGGRAPRGARGRP